MENIIEKQIELSAPLARVWKALSDSKQFGQWFRASFDGPFIPGKSVVGQLKVPGYEHVRIDMEIKALEPQTYFAYAWHPFAVDPKVDYSQETPTLVEFRLESVGDEKTLLTVTESGFDKIPADRRAEAFRMNSGGWAYQVSSIQTYVSDTSQ